MSAALNEAWQLFAAASRDRTSFKILLESGRVPNETIGFLAQPASEKCLKVVPVTHNIPFERTHDLERLAEIATNAGITLSVATNGLRQLNSYAVALRYEGSGVFWVSEEFAQTEEAHWQRELDGLAPEAAMAGYAPGIDR